MKDMVVRSRQGILRVLAALALAAGVSACGGEEEATPEAAAPPGEITVVADEYSFEGIPETLPAGETTFSLDNQGQEGHMMIVAEILPGSTFEEAIEAQGRKGTAREVGVIEPVPPGETSPSQLTSELTPGNYGALCPLRNKQKKFHYDLGQKVEFTVE